MTTLVDIRARVRLDLKDPAGSGERWTETELDRAIARAVRRFSRACPRELSITRQCLADDYRYEVFAGNVEMEDYLGPISVEYPTGEVPPAFTGFRIEGTELLLLTERPPTDDDWLTFRYEALHQLTETSTTLARAHEEVVVLGAVAHAAEMGAGNAINRINASDDTYRQYRQLACDREARFAEELGEIRRRRAHVAPSTVAISGYEV